MNLATDLTILQTLFYYLIVDVYAASNINSSTVFPPTLTKGDSVSANQFGIYTFTTIKIALESSGEESSLITFSLGSYKDASAHYLETAALDNKEKRRRVQEILVETRNDKYNPKSDGDAHDDFFEMKAAHQANLIYPETVQGLIWDKKGSDISNNLQNINTISNHASTFSLNMGTRLNCFNDLLEEPEIESLLLSSSLNYFNFILCETNLAHNYTDAKVDNNNPNSITSSISKLMKFKQRHPTLDVLGLAIHVNDSFDLLHELNDMTKSSKPTEELAREQNFTMLLIDVIDVPAPHYFRESFYYEGLFKLTVIPSLLKSKMPFKILEYPENNPGMQLSSTTIAMVVTGSLILVALFAAGMIKYIQDLKQAQKQLNLANHRRSQVDKNLYDGAEDIKVNTTLGFPYDASLEIAWNQLDIDYASLLGRGNFGYVYKARMKSDQENEVALKLAGIDSHRSALMRMISEIKLLIMLGAHPHIVTLKGICTEGPVEGAVYLATEICSLGCLQNYLRKDQPYNRPQPQHPPENVRESSTANEEEYLEAIELTDAVTFQEMVRWSGEIACAMEFISSKNIIHADLATRNVLLTSDKTTRVCDFGLSRCVDSNTNCNVRSHDEPLPWRWMALEALKRSEYSIKSDVWSYGVTLWEIFSNGDAPYPIYRPNKEFVEGLLNGQRLGCPPKATPEIYEIMSSCWLLEPNERPTFAHLLQQFTDMAKNCAETGF